MAQKRMFDKTITNQDNFLEMPDSTQNLYFHLSMEADDDGFVDNWKSIMRMTGKKEDDLKLLIAKSYIIPFDSGIIVIKHWRINNYLRKDRYNETKYLKEKSQLKIEENQEYSLKNSCGIPHGIPSGNPEEKRIEKNSIEYIYTQNDTKCDTKCDDLFIIFWNNYPKKRDKGKAEKWFQKNKPSKELVDLMIKKINLFKETDDWKKNNGQYIPYPSTWLNAKGWEDELPNQNDEDGISLQEYEEMLEKVSK